MDPMTKAKLTLVVLVVITVVFCVLAFLVDQAVMQLLDKRSLARARPKMNPEPATPPPDEW